MGQGVMIFHAYSCAFASTCKATYLNRRVRRTFILQIQTHSKSGTESLQSYFLQVDNDQVAFRVKQDNCNCSWGHIGVRVVFGKT